MKKKHIIFFLKKMGVYRYLKNLKEKFQEKRYQKYAPILMKEIGKILENNNIDYWLEYGTLLGAVREKGVIKHDYDIDIGILKDRKEIEKIDMELKKNGFKNVHCIKIENIETERKYIKNGITLDIYFFEKIGEYYKGYVYTDFHLEKEKGGFSTYEVYFQNFESINYNLFEQKFKVPNNYEKHLEEYYGKDYMIPNKEWNEKKAYNIKKIDKIGVKIKSE